MPRKASSNPMGCGDVGHVGDDPVAMHDPGTAQAHRHGCKLLCERIPRDLEHWLHLGLKDQGRLCDYVRRD